MAGFQYICFVQIETRKADILPEAIFGTRIDKKIFYGVQNVMISKGILNPQILSLIARVRHTNTLVISDRGFPYWPMIETVDISLVDDVPTVLQVFQAIRSNFDISDIWMAQEFIETNAPDVCKVFANAITHIPLHYEAHVDLKKRVPGVIGLIRTGDTIQYANMVLVSGPVEPGMD